MMDATWILLPVVAALALAVGYLLHKASSDRRIGGAEREAHRIAETADRDAKRIVETAQREAEARQRTTELEAREAVLKARASFEDETRRRERDIQTIEQRVLTKEEEIARKLEQLERRLVEYTDKDKGLVDRERRNAETERRLGAALEEQRRKLESIAGLTAEEAKRQLLAQMEGEARREAQLIGMRLEEEARETAREKAKEVLATTIQRLAPDYTVETAVSVVDLPSDDMKGRIIGREGRNIRALELHTGVDLIVDDTPEAVLDLRLRSVSPRDRPPGPAAAHRRRAHPSGAHRGSRQQGQAGDGGQHLKEEGEKACFEVGVHGLHPELVKLVGRMKYRTSYGQNCLQHSKEVAWLAGMMAAEVKGDVKLAKRMGLLHDIGKALTHEQDGSHPELSLQVLTKYNE